MVDGGRQLFAQVTQTLHRVWHHFETIDVNATLEQLDSLLLQLPPMT